MAISEHTNNRIEAYLDGLLTGAELAAFQSQVAGDTELRAALERQREIDRSLRAWMQLPAHAPLVATHLNGWHGREQISTLRTATNANAVAPETQRQPLTLLRRFAIAALFAVAILSVWAVWTQVLTPSWTSPQLAKLSIPQYFNRKAADGFKPYWKCENEQQFADTFRERLGQSLQMRTLPAGVQCAGLDYTTTMSARTIAVLLDVHGTQLMVLIDRTTADCDESLPADSNLHAFTRSIGDLELIEVSPLSQPRALDLFYDPR